MIRFLIILSITLFLFNYEIFAEAGDNLAQTIDTSSDSTLVNTLFFGFALFVSLFGSYFYYKFKTINKQKQHVDEELKRQMLINNHADDYIAEMELFNAKFTAIMNIDTAARIIFNRNGDIVIMNKAANQLFDINSKDIDNLKIWHLYKNFRYDSSSGQLNFESEFKDLLNSPEDKLLDFHERELIYKNKSISEKIREVEINEEQLFCVSFEDINNFKIHQNDLVESEKRFREMAEYSPQPFFEFDLTGKITYVSNAGYALFYLNKNDLNSGLNITDFLIPSDVEHAFIDIEKATKERLSFAVEYTLINKNKTELPAMVFTSPIVRNDAVVGHRGIITDVSQQKKQLKTMQTDADFYNSIIRSVPVSLYAKSADDGKYFLWNSAAEKMFGIPAEKIIGKRDIEIFPKEKALNYVRSDKEVCSSGKPVNVPDEKYPDNEGESQICRTMKFPYYDTEGKPIYIFGISENITEYKETFEDLQKRNEFIETIIGNLPIGIMVIDFNDESLMYANSVAENIFGSEKTDINSVDKLLLRLFPNKELRIAEKIAFVKSIFDEKPTNHIWENIELTGTKKTVTLLNIPLPNQGVIISIVNDISQEISNEQLLLDSKDTNAAFLKAVPDMIFVCDRQDVIIDFKPGINNKTYVSPDQFIGKPVEKILPPNVSKLIKINIEKTFDTNHSQVIEYQLLIDGLVCDYEGRMVQYGDDKVMIIIRDITAKKDAERALTQSEQDLRELNKAKDKLFSIISHDLRNPISAFLGLTQIIYESAFEMPRVEIKEILSALNSSANNVYQLLQNMLYWSQLNNGKIQYSPEIIDLCSLTAGYKSIVAANAAEKNIAIDIDIQDQSRVFADTNMLTSVVLNLLSNAVKFTDSGGKVKLVVSQNGKITTISIEDNGQGMSKKDVDTILNSDNSITTAGTYNEKGVGLGLVVTREFVAMHKDKHGAGEFSVESQPGKGSKFSFTLLNAGDDKLPDKK